MTDERIPHPTEVGASYAAAVSSRRIAADSVHARRSRDAARFVDQPLRHAITLPPPRYSRTGRTFRAVCGAQVAVVLDGDQFRPGADRTCSKCSKAVQS